MWSLFSVGLAAALMGAASTIGLTVSVIRAVIHGGRSLLTHCRFPDAIGYSSVTNECPFDPTRIYVSTQGRHKGANLFFALSGCEAANTHSSGLINLLIWLPEDVLPHVCGTSGADRSGSETERTSCFCDSCPEYHSDPVGASDRDLCGSDAVFCPVFGGVRHLPGAALLPEQEEKQTLRQSGQQFRPEGRFPAKACLVLMRENSLFV